MRRSLRLLLGSLHAAAESGCSTSGREWAPLRRLSAVPQEVDEVPVVDELASVRNIGISAREVPLVL